MREPFEERSFYVPNFGSGACLALARRLLRPARKQLPDSSVAYLCFDLHHHELRGWKTIGLALIEAPKQKAEPRQVRPLLFMLL
jgi:hypothetical protein